MRDTYSRKRMRSITSIPEHENKRQFSPWIKYLDLSTKLIAISVAVCFCISIIFDYGFYYALDISLQELPTNINDHIKSSLMWLPMTLVPAIVLTFSEINSIKRGPPKTDKDLDLDRNIVESIINNQHFPLPKWLKYNFYISVVVLIAAIVVKLFISELLFAMLIIVPLFIILMTISWRIFMHPQVYAKGYSKYLRIFLYASSTLLIVFWLGYMSGKKYVSFKYHDYTISTKDKRFNNTEVNIIRTYDKYAFVGYSTHCFAFLPHEEITSYGKMYFKVNSRALRNVTLKDLVVAIKYALTN